jgi:PhnB protein
VQFIAYLNFKGNCRAAFDFYRDVFKGDIKMRMTYGDSPMCDEMPADSHNLIMHTLLEADGAVLMGADGPPPHGDPGQGTCININVETPGEAERIFAALSAGGEVQMPLQETFWAIRWGSFTDRFGKPWMINCMKEV